VRSTTPPLPTVPTPLPRLPQFVEASLSCGGGAGAGAGRPVEMVPTHAVVMGVGHVAPTPSVLTKLLLANQ